MIVVCRLNNLFLPVTSKEGKKEDFILDLQCFTLVIGSEEKVKVIFLIFLMFRLYYR